MNEQQPQSDGEHEVQAEIDPEHPWVVASQFGAPAPVPSSIGVEPVTLEQDGKEVDAIMLSIVDPTGIKNAVIPPVALHQLVMQGAGILDMLQKKQQQGLVVANEGDMRNVVKQQQQFDSLRRK